MNGLLARHASAWMADRWYRRAWFVWPFAATLLAGSMLTVNLGRPLAPPMPPGWVHPTNDQMLGKALAILRDQARTDAGALKLLQKRADDGQAIAQFYMGTLFDPTIDKLHASAERTSEAIGWYRKSADQHNMTAAGNLGGLLAYDRPGHAADYAEAFRWLDMAAPTVPQAQRELGQLYRLGRGVPVDVAKGMDLLRAAAEHNDPVAELLLAQAYDRGSDGLTQDRHEAAMLFQKAALANNPLAQRELGVHLMNGLGVPVDRDKALNWFRRAADHGDAFSKAQLEGMVNSGGAPALPRSTASPKTPSPFNFAPIHP